MEKNILQTVVETPEFAKQAKICMEEIAKENFINFIAKNPLAGELIEGTGGVRKVRWQSDLHRGKRGGVRIIYYYHNEDIPIFLFTVYKKNKKENISLTEKADLRKLIQSILKTYGR